MPRLCERVVLRSWRVGVYAQDSSREGSGRWKARGEGTAAFREKDRKGASGNRLNRRSRRRQDRGGEERRGPSPRGADAEPLNRRADRGAIK